MPLSRNNETINETRESGIKIKELPGIYGVELSEETIKEFGERLITLEEIEKLRIHETAEERLDALKGLLGLKAEIDTSGIKKEAFTIKKAFESGEKEAAEALEEAGKAMDKLGDSDIGTKAKEGITKIKKISGSAVEKMSQASFFKTLESLPLIGWLFKLIGSFLKSFGLLGGKVEKIKEKVGEIKEKLKPEEREKLIYEAKSTLINEFPQRTEQINKILNNPNIDEKVALELIKKIKSGKKLGIIDVQNLLPGLKTLFLSEKEKKEIVEKARKKVVLAMQKGIKSEYGIDIEGKKLDKLKELSIKYFNLSEENALVLNQIVKNKGFQYKDLYGFLIELPTKGTAFSLSLISEEIVPLSAIGLNIIETGGDIINVYLGWLGVTEQISYEDLADNFSNLENKEMLLGLLYRKGGILFSSIGYIAEKGTRLLIESGTNTSVKSIDLIKNSLTSNYSKLANNFDILANALGDVDNGGDIIRKATENLRQVEKNYKALNILKEFPEETSQNVQKVKTLIKKLGFEKLDNVTDMKSLRSILDGQFSIKNTNKFASGGSLASKFGYGANADLYELNKGLENIARSQKSFLGKEFIRGAIKWLEIKDIPKISRLGDRLMFNFNNIDQVKSFSKKLETLANKSPELIGGIFDKLPIIAVAGLAISKEGNTFDNLQKELKYLFPIVGPILMIGEGGIKYHEDTGEIEILNPVETAMGGVLLGLDGVFITKAFATKGFQGAGSYMIKPIKDIYSIGKGSIELAHSLTKVSRLSAVKETAKKGIKYVSKIPKYGKIAAALLAGSLIGIEAFANNSEETLDELEKEGLIINGKPNYKKIKEEIEKNNLNEEEKQTIIDIIIVSNSPIELDGIDIGIENGNLKIISNNKQIMSDWFLDNEAKTQIHNLFGIKYTSDNFNYIES